MRKLFMNFCKLSYLQVKYHKAGRIRGQSENEKLLVYLPMYTAYPVCDREIKYIYFMYNLQFYGRNP